MSEISGSSIDEMFSERDYGNSNSPIEVCNLKICPIMKTI